MSKSIKFNRKFVEIKRTNFRVWKQIQTDMIETGNRSWNSRTHDTEIGVVLSRT